MPATRDDLSPPGPTNTSSPKLRTDLERYLIQERLKNRRRSYQHPSYQLERQLFEAIRLGADIEAVSLLDRINSLERAELSPDPIRSLKNSLIGSCTIFARAAISGGVDSESAFMLSDLLIRQVERVSSRQQAESLEYDMLLPFTNAVRESRQSGEAAEYSPAIARVRQFVRQSVHGQMSLSDAAEHVNVHPNYLSTLFTKECGESLMAYYDRERIEAISQFLRFTDTPLAEVAVNFEFSSFSHFSSYFKKHTGLTPRDYRSQFVLEQER